MGILVNIVNAIIGYNDIRGVNSNPEQKYFDWSRRYNAIAMKEGTSDTRVLQPNETVTLFDGTRSLPVAPVAGVTLVSLKSQVGVKSIYRLSLSDANFRTQRSTGFTQDTEIDISVNQNSIIVMELPDALNGDFSNVQVGDIIRIKGAATNDNTDNVFSPINSGSWVVLSVASPTKITATRPKPQKFQGIDETVTLGAVDTDNQVQILSQSGVQVDDYFEITGTLSPASYGNYKVLQVAANHIDFVSGTPLPEETDVLLSQLSDLFVYSDAKKLVFVETDQNSILRYNNDVSDNNRIDPVQVGSEYIPGFSTKWGLTWKCVIQNKSATNSAVVKWITAE